MPRPQRTVPWLDQRGAVFYVNWYDPKLKRTLRETLGTSSPEEARLRFSEWLAGGPRRARRDAGVTVEGVLTAYFEEHVQKHVSDVERQRYGIEHLKAYFTDTLLCDVDIPKSRGYAQARRDGLIGGGKRRKDKTGGDSTIRRELNMLVAAANHALRWKRVDPAGMPSIELPAQPRSDEIKWLSKADLKRLFDAAEGDLKAFCRITYYTAARRRSIEGLTRFQVDLQNGRMSLSKAGERVTKKRRPVVPIYPEIRADVEMLLAKTNSEWLFGVKRDFYKDFVGLCAGLKIDAHPHMLRHSRATHMLMDGEDIYKVARLLGDTVATVERVYGHFSTEYLATTSAVL